MVGIDGVADLAEAHAPFDVGARDEQKQRGLEVPEVRGGIERRAHVERVAPPAVDGRAAVQGELHDLVVAILGRVAEERVPSFIDGVDVGAAIEASSQAVHLVHDRVDFIVGPVVVEDVPPVEPRDLVEPRPALGAVDSAVDGHGCRARR